jgi:hypothetical protein
VEQHRQALRPVSHRRHPGTTAGDGAGPLRWASRTGSPRSTRPSSECISTARRSPASQGAIPNYQDPRLQEPLDHAIGRSRGGLTSKIHLVAGGRGRPLHLILTPASINDTTVLAEVTGGIRVARSRDGRPGPGRPRTRPGVVLAGKGYPSRANRAYLAGRGIKASIPGRNDQVAGRRRRGQAGGPPRLRRRPLPAPHRRRAVLQPTRELARYRHPHREDSSQLPSRNPARRDPDLDQDRLKDLSLIG